MPSYINNTLHRFNHMRSKRLQNQPHKYAPPNYGAKVQYAKPEDNLPLSRDDKTFIQQVTGVFLFLGRAVDSTLLMPLSAIASEQANPMEETMQKCEQFLDYVAS